MRSQECLKTLKSSIDTGPLRGLDLGIRKVTETNIKFTWQFSISPMLLSLQTDFAPLATS